MSLEKVTIFFANVSLLFLNTHKISATNNVIINKCKNGIRRVKKNSFLRINSLNCLEYKEYNLAYNFKQIFE